MFCYTQQIACNIGPAILSVVLKKYVSISWVHSQFAMVSSATLAMISLPRIAGMQHNGKERVLDL